MISKYLFRNKTRSARTSRQQGECAEQAAAIWLRRQGLVIIGQNFHSRFGEIDIIALDREHLVFIEVKLRNSDHYGGAAVTVDSRKQRKLIMTAQHYLNSQWHGATQPPCRFDVVTLSPGNAGPKINWYKAAFELNDNNYDVY